MKFAGFFMAEYANMVTVTCMATALYLGGWLPLWPVKLGSNYAPAAAFALSGAICIYSGLQARKRDRLSLRLFGVLFLVVAVVFLIPLVQTLLAPLFWFLAKTGLLLILFIWVRGTLPRFRYDQLMRFGWSFMFPVAVANLMITGLLVALVG
jgi:NADH-quinone oxidoreductase subunit H